MSKQFFSIFTSSRNPNLGKIVYENLKNFMIPENVERKLLELKFCSVGKNGIALKTKVDHVSFLGNPLPIAKGPIGNIGLPCKTALGKCINSVKTQKTNAVCHFNGIKFSRLPGLKTYEQNCNPLVRKLLPYYKPVTDLFGGAIVRHWHPHAQNRSVISSPPKYPLTFIQRWLYGGGFCVTLLVITYWGMLGVPCWAQERDAAQEGKEE